MSSQLVRMSAYTFANHEGKYSVSSLACCHPGTPLVYIGEFASLWCGCILGLFRQKFSSIIANM